MRKFIALSFVVSTLTYASNGLYFIGISPTSKGMGGTGVANATSSSADAAFKNPAMLSELPLKKDEISAEAATYFIKQNAKADNTGLGEKSSSSGVIFTPMLSAAYKPTDKLAVGLSAFTYGGAKADFTGEATLQELKVDSSITSIGPTVSYQLCDKWSFGISPHLVYGDLALNSKNVVLGTAQSTRPLHGTVGYAINVGTVVSPMKDLTVGLTASPKVRMRYKEVIDLDALNLLPAAAGGTSGVGDGILDDVDTENPAEVALGVAYAFTSSLKVTADGRYIGWSSADVFRDLAWRDQYVVAVGAEYRLEKLAIRAGFNYARSVIDTVSGENGFTNVLISGHNVSQQSLSNLNLVGLPGIATTHLCVGAGYDFTEKLSADFDFIYVPENTVVRSGTGVAPTLVAGAYSYTGKVSQWSLGLGAKYRF